MRSAVQWSPFVQTFRKQRYPWVQLAGHQGSKAFILHTHSLYRHIHTHTNTPGAVFFVLFFQWLQLIVSAAAAVKYQRVY